MLPVLKEFRRLPVTKKSVVAEIVLAEKSIMPTSAETEISRRIFAPTDALYTATLFNDHVVE
jgi:hypothetical protein